MMQGIVNIIKPTGMSSHDVIAQLRRIFQMKKIGHAGTLDPLAAGVLPVYLGQATRLIEYGDSDVKSYRAEFVLGFATDTEDSTGDVVASCDVPPVSSADVERVLARFRGAIEQVPSRYSAINIKGVKAYKLARQHTEFTLPVRQVMIHELSLTAHYGRRFVITVTCSQGTYVRSLIRDIGEALGTQACMTYLVRTQAGLFTIADAVTLEELAEQPEAHVLPVDLAIHDLPKTTCSDTQCAYLLQGRPVPFAGTHLAPDAMVRVYNRAGKLAGIVRFDQEHHVIHPHKMFADAM